MDASKEASSINMLKIIRVKKAYKGIFNEFSLENRVHSIFENGFNLEGKTRLVFVGWDLDGGMPGAIEVEKEDFIGLKPDNNHVFLFNYKRKTLGQGNFILDFSRADYFTSSLDIKGLDEDVLGWTLDLLMRIDEPLGLDMSLRDFLQSSAAQDLTLALAGHDLVFSEQVFRKFIGRGRGLTPSGDDILLGLLLLNQVEVIIWDDALSLLEALIEGEMLTTDISKNYYRWAFKGEFGAALIDLVEAMANADFSGIISSVSRVIRRGHSSGLDTLAGMALALEMIKRRKG